MTSDIVYGEIDLLPVIVQLDERGVGGKGVRAPLTIRQRLLEGVVGDPWGFESAIGMISITKGNPDYRRVLISVKVSPCLPPVDPAKENSC